MLLDSIQVRFMASDQDSGKPTFERRARILTRGAVRLSGKEERNWTYAVTDYDPNSARIVSAQAWIIPPDGGGAKSFGRKDFLDAVAVFNSYVWDSRRLLGFQSAGKVGAGGILVWEFEVEDLSPFSEWGRPFLQRFPAIRTEFEVIPAPGTQIEYKAGSPRLGNPSPGSEPGSLKWELLREEPISENLPMAFIPNPLAVSVRCKPSAAGTHAWDWGEISRTVSGITDPRIETAGDVAARAKAIVAGKTARWDRVRALADFVQASIVYLQMTEDRDELSGVRPQSPSEVLRNRYVYCKDKATILISLLRAIGVDSRMVLVTSGNPRAVSKDWPSASFNHAIVLISANGYEPPTWPAVDPGENGGGILFDPTNPFTPLGVLPPEDQGGFGLIVAPNGGRLIQLPISDPSNSRMTRKIEVAVDSGGRMEAKVSDDFFGLVASESYGERFSRSTEQYQDYVESWVHRANPLCENVHWTDVWSPSMATYTLDIGFSIPAFGRKMPDGLMLVSPELLPEYARLEPWTVGNDGVVALSSGSVDESVRIHIPSGYLIEEVPDEWRKDDPLMSAEISYQNDGSSVMLTKRVSMRGGFLGKEDYEALRAIYREIHDAERRSVILRETAAKSQTATLNSP